MNTHVRDNLNFVHETHGPLWIPAQDISDASTFGPTTMIGSDPDSLDIIAMAGGHTAWFHATRLVPNDWISGGITWKLHYRKGAANAGDFVFQLQYGHISTTEDPLAVGGNEDKTFTPADNTTYQIETLGTTTAPTAGELMRLAFRRDGGSGSDTSADALHMIGLEGEYT